MNVAVLPNIIEALDIFLEGLLKERKIPTEKNTLKIVLIKSVRILTTWTDFLPLDLQ